MISPTGRNRALVLTGSRVSITVPDFRSADMVMVKGFDGPVPGGGLMAGVVIFTSVALPVSKRVAPQSPGIPVTARALNPATTGELPAGSAGTGMKSVTLARGESVVMVQV